MGGRDKRIKMTQVTSISPPGTLAAGYEEPFEMLQACHERVGRMLDLVARVRAHMRDNGADEQVRQATRDVMRYFDRAAPQHHRDEELHVFPMLIGMQDEQLIRLVARLQGEHQEMDARWTLARSLLEEVESGSRTRFNEADEAILDSFCGLYAAHMKAEEEFAFPRASKAMDGDRIKAMSSEMMARRGVTAR
jgi:hemerythrin-like domain-containing protein